MTEFFSASGYFSLALTVLAYLAGDFCQRKWKKPFLNPILIGTILVILALRLLNIPTQVYREGCQLLSMLMTPATICLSIAFYEQFQKLRHQLWAILAGVAAGCAASLGSVYLLCRICRLDRVLMLSVLPKNITTAIGVVMSQELGGIGAITTAMIILTGILGNMAGPALCRILGIRDEISQGVAFGTASHVIGTTKATQLSQLTGAVSTFSLTIAGLVTALALSFLAPYL